jgi:hypothetical protein
MVLYRLRNPDAMSPKSGRLSDGQMHANHMVSGLLPERLALPFPLGDRGAKPRQHDFELTHGAAQLGQHGVEITYRSSGPDVDDVGYQAGSVGVSSG